MSSTRDRRKHAGTIQSPLIWVPSSLRCGWTRREEPVRLPVSPVETCGSQRNQSIISCPFPHMVFSESVSRLHNHDLICTRNANISKSRRSHFESHGYQSEVFLNWYLLLDSSWRRVLLKKSQLLQRLLQHLGYSTLSDRPDLSSWVPSRRDTGKS